jgi:hypothetical protein
VMSEDKFSSSHFYHKCGDKQHKKFRCSEAHTEMNIQQKWRIVKECVLFPAVERRERERGIDRSDCSCAAAKGVVEGEKSFDFFCLFSLSL